MQFWIKYISNELTRKRIAIAFKILSVAIVTEKSSGSLFILFYSIDIHYIFIKEHASQMDNIKMVKYS